MECFSQFVKSMDENVKHMHGTMERSAKNYEQCKYICVCALRRESHACCTVASFVCFHRIYPFLRRCTVQIV